MPHAKTTRYPVLRPIVYHNPESEFAGQVITPDQTIAQEGLTFPHLVDSEIKLLQRKRILGKPIKKETPEPTKAEK